FLSSGSTGDVYLENVIAVEKIDIKRSTGDVEFEELDASEIEIKTSTGDVEGTLLTEKTFSIKTNTGDVDVPRLSSGGLCKITTDTGDIDIEIK
ncbi:MAG: DUF4097 family beta strand repeat protein, partial [Clostridia bacterium]|nr:DUF4097 family beta strand repeat protein [Clostridia bacterium]